MKKFSVITLLVMLCCTFSCHRDNTSHEAGFYLDQLQERDSILIADQLRYGLRINDVREGSKVVLPQSGDTLRGGIEVVDKWVVDTLAVHRAGKDAPADLDLDVHMTFTSFDEGIYHIQDMDVMLISPDGDTVHFNDEPRNVEFETIPVDTATFVIHDIKDQLEYTADEVFPYFVKDAWPFAAAVLVLGAVIAAICIILARRRRKKEEMEHHDPAHIVALRKLDKYRGDKFWAPEKQKIFYSGVTDALREYMDARYGVSAMEKTTAEIFKELKGSDIPAEYFTDLKALFERADFVKFAKHTATDEENASVLPLAVRFVTDTYIEEEAGNVL